MKLKLHHWLILAVMLTAVWLGLTVGLSYKYLDEKDPVPVEKWTSDQDDEKSLI